MEISSATNDTLFLLLAFMAHCLHFLRIYSARSRLKRRILQFFQSTMFISMQSVLPK